MSSSVGCIRGFPRPYVSFPLIPGGKECLRQSQATGNLSPGTRAQNAVDARDNTDYVLGNPCGPFVEAFRTQKPHRQTRPSVDREAGPGGGGRAGAPASGASHRTKQAAGRRPRAPIFARQPLAVVVTDLQLPSPSPPRPARTPARLPFCLLSPSVLDGPGPFPGSGYLVSIGAGGARAGGCGGVAGPLAWGAGTVLPPPLSLALPRLPLLPQVGASCRPDFAPRRALLLRARGRSRGRRRRGSGRRGAAGTLAQHG